MIKILSIKTSKDIEFVLGTTVEIIAFLNTDKPSSIKITVEDPSETVMVNSADMSRANNKVYNYVYQSTSTDEEGTYVVTVTVTNGGYTAVRQTTFDLAEQLND